MFQANVYTHKLPNLFLKNIFLPIEDIDGVFYFCDVKGEMKVLKVVKISTSMIIHMLYLNFTLLCINYFTKMCMLIKGKKLT